jgi:hypothetical protein
MNEMRKRLKILIIKAEWKRPLAGHRLRWRIILGWILGKYGGMCGLDESGSD